MKTDHKVLLWCAAAWMCCIVVNCRVEFFDADGNALREEDILNNDWIVKDDRVKIWEDSYRRKPYRSDDEGTEDVTEEIKKKCKDICDVESETLEDGNVKCLSEEDPVRCECLKNVDGKLVFNYKTKECETCDCGANANGCSFDNDGTKKCECKTNFAQKGEICEEKACVDKCGVKEDVTCKLDGSNMKCECTDEKKKFDPSIKECKTCDCGSNANGCSFDNDGTKKCECKTNFAQKGEICEDKACVDMCGVKEDVICKLEGNNIKCECKDKEKELDDNIKECRIPCMDDANCTNGALCEDVQDKKFCECLSGTSGDKCEIIKDCVTGKYSKCTGARGNCIYNSENEIAECLCKGDKKLKDLSGYCANCKCGEHSEDCKFENDQVKCTCKSGYSSKDGKCVACICGENSDSCSFIGGEKKCECKKGFGDDGGTCKACNCGENSEGCSFEEGKPKCICKENFGLKDGKCEACNCGENSNSCSFENGEMTCICKDKFALKDGKCEACDCGEDSESCRFEGGKKICVCKEGVKEINGICRECNCGANSTACEFQKDTKICTCHDKYAQNGKDKNSQCEACKCGDKSKGCEFKEKNKKECHCEHGYVDNKGTCTVDPCIMKCGVPANGEGEVQCKREANGDITSFACICRNESLKFDSPEKGCRECSCGENTKDCSFVSGKEVCTCNDKFALKDGKCKACNCGEGSDSCRYEGENKICVCKKGYKENNGICEECNCGGNSTSCEFQNGNKICKCNDKFAQNGNDKNAQCEECVCGENTKKCRFENGNKKCECEDLFAYNKEGKCIECKCGSKSKGCTFNEEDKKECICEDKYGDNNGTCTEDQCVKKCGVPPNGDEEVNCEGKRYGDGTDIKCKCFDTNLQFDSEKMKCRETCEDDTKCKHLGKCVAIGANKFCKCRSDTDGHQCEILTLCGKGKKFEKCIDDRGNCTYDYTKQRTTCDCSDSKLYDESQGYCQDTCKEDKDCKNNKICFAKKYCSCETGKTGDNCEEATGCVQKLKEKCENGGAECAFNKTAPNFASCVCKNKDLVFNEEDSKCVAKFCINVGCKKPATCELDADTKTAYCKCPSGQYYDYNTETCSGPDKCLLRKTPCKENEVCENGSCKCKGEIKDDKCIIKFCVEGACFDGAECDETTATCKCAEGKYFTGSSCKDVKCIKNPFDESCACPENMQRNKDTKKCEPTGGKKTCDKDCGIGTCVGDTCSCITGISILHDGKCVLDKDKICASKELKDSSTCKCTGKYTLAKDDVTCALVTCSDSDAKQTCTKAKATCKMTWKGGNSIGYSCNCLTGYILNKEKEICTDPCSVYEIAEECGSKGQMCYNSYSVKNAKTANCDCAPPFTTKTKNCDDVAEFAYLISGIPVMKQRYQMEYGIDYMRLNSDLRQSLEQMYNKDIFDTGYLHDYVEDGDVLKTSVWVRFKLNISGQLNRFKLQAQSFPKDKCEECDTDLYLWPPKVVLKGNEFNDVKAVSLNVCAEDMKKTLCGEGAECKDNKCFCPRGYRTLEHTIKTISDKARILRCEKSNVADLDECALGTHTCPGNTTCFKTPGTYICKCKPGYWKSPEDDQKDCVDMCTPSPCDKGTCSMKKDKFDCKCQAGYTGSYCDETDTSLASAKQSTVVVGAVLGTILIVGVLAALFFYIKKRKNSYSEDFMPAPRQDIASEMRERRPIRGGGVVNTSYE